MDNHAEEVAGVMISQDGRAPGVAPQAQLHASTPSPGTGQRDYAIAAYHVARRTTTSGEGIDAINMSFGLPLQGFEGLDGTSHLTHFVDWSASRHDVLYVVAGRETDGGFGPVPTDNFNGITVAASTRSFGDTFASAWSGNIYDEDAEGDRVSVDLLAPGVLIDTIQLGNAIEVSVGSSFATPHVTGAVALLQQYGKYQIDNAGWSSNARRHELMKAILLNSADKLSFVHNSNRTIFNADGQKWDETVAHASFFDPLDLTMGAGHLNVGSALINYKAGEHEPGTVSLLGWDFSPLPTTGSFVEYVFDAPVAEGSWVAITLAWDRTVTSTEVGDTYNSTTEFFTNPIETELANLDLYLLDSNDNVIYASTAQADSVEHIFVEASGNLKVRVENVFGGTGEEDGYGLAWWAGELDAPIEGDFDEDGDVDGDDLGEWKGGFGPGGSGDADGDGDSDGNDFLVWQNNVGMMAATPVASQIPEPATLALILLATCGIFLNTSRQQQ